MIIEQQLRFLQSRLITGIEFNEVLEKINDYYQKNCVNIKYIITDKSGNKYTYGKNIERTTWETCKERLDNDYNVEIFLWQNDDILTMEQCKKLFNAFWNGHNRDNTTGLIATDRNGTTTKCDNTLKKWNEEKKKIAFIMFDLDHFKDVNSKYGHETGTEVIFEFSQLLAHNLSEKGILIHQSGDEFNYFLTYENSFDIIFLAYNLRKEIKKHSFSIAPGVDLTMALGIVFFEGETISFSDARNFAEKTYDGKGKNQSKQRDSIRVNKKNNNIIYGDNSIKLALSRILSNLNKNIFNNVFLDFLSEYISEVDIEGDFQSEIDQIFNWINPNWCSNIRCTKNNSFWDTKAEFSKIEASLAILHGLLRNSQLINKQVKYIVEKQQEQTIVIVKVDGSEICKFDDLSFDLDAIEWETTIPNINLKNTNLKRVVLVNAGYDDSIDLPHDLFYNIVKVDTRPTIGGALNDLWEAALSELISNMRSNSNFTDIIISGDINHAQKVSDYLEKIELWDKDVFKYSLKYISKKIFKSESDILEFKKKFTKHIFKISEIDLTDEIFNVYSNSFFELKEDVIPDEERINRFLDRNLSYDKISLDILCGCKAKSISDAYPIVLEIIRSAAKIKEDNIIDQAGRELVELMDFRVLLEKPKSDNYPDYFRYDEDDLLTYYKKTFGNDDGLFRNEFIQNNQFDNMIDHIIKVIQNKEQKYATRRAILVVPNKFGEVGCPYKKYPLGLVSVWVAPRFYNDEVILDFSFTWRTVEALVGLPESMFASVKFAEELKDIIDKKCNHLLKIRVGQISYIAHSLHMFLNKESMNIVRGIINNASI